MRFEEVVNVVNKDLKASVVGCKKILETMDSELLIPRDEALGSFSHKIVSGIVGLSAYGLSPEEMEQEILKVIEKEDNR